MSLKGARYFYEMCKGSQLESISGLGSSLQNSTEIRQALPKLIKKYQITTLLDCPCGDWNWMQHVDLSSIYYIGADVVSEIIASNKERFSRHNIRFEEIDITRQTPPQCQIILCRDLLFHLTIEDQICAMNRFRLSGAKYILTTTFPWLTENTDLTSEEKGLCWGWRMINVELPPFNLKNPMEKIVESAQCKNREVRMYLL